MIVRSDAKSRESSGEAVRDPQIVVLIPCYNEAVTIAKVVSGFKSSLPQARIYVYDNNSRDGTARVAREAGASIRVEQRQGKGNVVRRMFADIDADCYIMVDGDGTYDASVAAELSALVCEQGFDFVNVARRSIAQRSYPRGHRFGNFVLTELVKTFFGRYSDDMLSGYKAFSRRFAKSFPAMSSGFEIETELTVHALEMRMPMAEIVADYDERPHGSASKLRTIHDGMKILLLIGRLIKDERSFQFFGAIGVLAGATGLILGVPVVMTYFETGLVPRLPTAVLSLGMGLLGWLSIFTGITLDVVTKARREMKRLAYLSIPAVGALDCAVENDDDKANV